MNKQLLELICELYPEYGLDWWHHIQIRDKKHNKDQDRCTGWSRLEKDPEGEYVEYEDYHKLQVMLAEVTLQLEDYIKASYPDYLLDYPHNQAKFEGDMEIITEARKLLEGL